MEPRPKARHPASRKPQYAEQHATEFTRKQSRLLGGRRRWERRPALGWVRASHSRLLAWLTAMTPAHPDHLVANPLRLDVEVQQDA